MADVLEVYEGSGRPVEDLALEGWMLDRAAAGTVCFTSSSWPGPVVVLGYAQPPEDVDLEWCRDHGVPVLRRLSGGTGVVYRGDLGVSLALPASHPWALGVIGLYGRFLDVLEPALRAVGSDVRRVPDPRRATRVRSPICFQDQLADTLLVGNRKAVGCAQTRRRGAVLIHAAVLLGLDADLYARVFRVDRSSVERSLTAAVSGVEPRAVAHAVVDRLSTAIELETRPRPFPVLEASLVETYRQPRWSPVRID